MIEKIEPEISDSRVVGASVEVEVEAERHRRLLDVVDVEGGDDRGGVVDLDGRADAGCALVSAREVDGDRALSDDVVFFSLFSKKSVLEHGLINYQTP
jgi:hypothetical protein